MHGWGAFALERIRAGDFVGEYRGELVSQDEVDERLRFAFFLRKFECVEFF